MQWQFSSQRSGDPDLQLRCVGEILYVLPFRDSGEIDRGLFCATAERNASPSTSDVCRPCVDLLPDRERSLPIAPSAETAASSGRAPGANRLP